MDAIHVTLTVFVHSVIGKNSRYGICLKNTVSVPTLVTSWDSDGAVVSSASLVTVTSLPLLHLSAVGWLIL